MKRLRLSRLWAMRNTPDASEYVAQPRVPAAFIFSTGSTTRSAICSRCSPSPGTPFMTSSEWITSRMSIWTSFTWTFLCSTSASWVRRHAVNVVDMAVRTAYGRRGVAHICIPKDIQEWPVSDKMRSNANIAGHSGDWAMPSTARPADTLLRKAAAIINDGSRVTIMVGRGALGRGEEVAQLADTVGGPVVKALLGKAVLPDRSPYTTGGLGLLGTAPSVDAMEECDTLILIGTSYPYMEFLPKPGQAKCVQIELDPTRIGLRHQVDAALVGDAKTILQALLPLLKRKNNKFLKKAQERMKTWNELMEERGTRQDMPMKPQVVTHTLNKLLDDDAIVSSDSGTIATWTARYIEMRGAMQFSSPARLPPWPMVFRTASVRPSHIQAARSSASLETVGSPCLWASWRRL